MTGRDGDDPTRRDFLRSALATGLGLSAGARAAMATPGRAGARPTRQATMIQRPIPSSGEAIPVVGLGTWQTFDAGTSEEERAPLREVLRLLVERGGTLVDSSPMYGRSEQVVGDLSRELDIGDRLFFATKVWTRGREAGVRQMETSMRRMGADPMDLMQVHNLLDVDRHLDTLGDWKQAGRVRYVGITHYQVGAYAALERLIRSERLDFVQLNYSIAERTAEQRLLPAAADHGVAVLVNQPFDEGRLFRRVRGRTLPDWAAEADCSSWGQLFLKYILGAPQVTSVIPGTGDPEHLVDNVGAGVGRLPDTALRRRMIDALEA